MPLRPDEQQLLAAILVCWARVKGPVLRRRMEALALAAKLDVWPLVLPHLVSAGGAAPTIFKGVIKP
jgi:hypothetical protein